jgi:hypothetical protein
MFTAIKASPIERIWNFALVQMIVGEFVTKVACVYLHADASATTWGRLSQVSKMRIRISTGAESIVVSIFWRCMGKYSRRLKKTGSLRSLRLKLILIT